MVVARLATLKDIPALVRWGAGQHARSNYAHAPYAPILFQRTLKECMTSPDARVWVATRHERIRGLLIGLIEQMHWAAAQYATDLVFSFEAGGDLLLRKFLDWCDARKITRIDMGVTQDDPKGRIDRLYRSNGLVRAGGMYHKINGGA